MNEVRCGVEIIEPDHWMAFAFDLIGCWSSGTTDSQALEGLREKVRGWGPSTTNAELVVGERYVPPDEQMRSTSLGAIYIVNAFFEDDVRALSEADVMKAQQLLKTGREDLLASIPLRRSAGLDEVLLHIGSAEWWYWDRLDLAFSREKLSDDALERLDQARRLTLRRIPEMAGKELVGEKQGELWSPRKILRRLISHEGEHAAQVRQMLGR